MPYFFAILTIGRLLTDSVLIQRSLTMRAQKGSALFLILIAVALFAALSYALTQSGRGGGDISKEQAKLYAAQLVQMADDVRQGTQRMALTGTPISSIMAGTGGGMYGGIGSDNGFPSFCTTGATCVFASEGGAVSLPLPPREAIDMNEPLGWYASNWAGPNSFNSVFVIGLAPGEANTYAVTNVGTDEADDIMVIYPIKKEVCEEINRGLGISDPMGDFPVNPLPNQAACAHHISADGYIFYSLVAPR